MDYERAQSVEEAITLLNEPGVTARILCGGTDFTIELRRGEVTCDRVVDVSRIPELHRLERQNDEVVIGAAVSFARLLTSDLIRKTAPILAEMAAEAGAVQLRNMGSLGGNVANAALAADSLPVLVALDAEADLAGPESERTLPVVGLVTGPGRTALQPGELITAFRFRPPEGRSTFIKLGRRNALNIARLSMSAVGRLDAAGRIAEVRLVPGAALRQTRRVTEVEELLVGHPPESELLRAAGERMARVMIDVSGHRWSTPYKQPVIATLTRRALARIFCPAEDEERAGTLETMERLHREPDHPVAPRAPEPESHPHPHVVHAGPPRPLTFTLNGEEVTVAVPVGLSLLTVLRDTLGMVGAKEGCYGGECGACTVILDGEAVLSCLLLAHQVAGREVVTIEGLGGPGGGLNDLQEAFIEHGAVQCGICIPGMILSAEALLARTLDPTRAAIRYAIAGNLCRCTGYQQIVDAIAATAEKRRKERAGEVRS